MEKLLSRITIDPAVGHGKPTIRHTRYTVESILEYLAGGDSVDDVLTEFSDLEKGDVLACIAYANAALRFKDIEIPEA